MTYHFVLKNNITLENKHLGISSIESMYLHIQRVGKKVKQIPEGISLISVAIIFLQYNNKYNCTNCCSNITSNVH